MSNNYDNWERLVVAVLRREKDRQLALAHSRESSISSGSSSFNFGLDSPVHEQSLQLEASSSKVNETDRERLFPSATSSSPGLSRFSAAASDETRVSGVILPTSNLKFFTFAELKIATRNFNSALVLGSGDFGTVFKGWADSKTLSWSVDGARMAVAIKKLHPERLQGFEEWQSEVNFLGRLSHPNLIKLHGYCRDDKELILVYEFMQRGSLENYLFRRSVAIEPLSWDIRLKIAIGAACGLAFLHTSDVTVIYRGFKASKILLDANYNAKIDFGFAKLGPAEGNSHVTTRVMGTLGYAAPEYFATGLLYVKSDVYGFGVVLLEMLTGLRVLDCKRPNGQQRLVAYAKPLLFQKRKLKTIMDPRMEGQYSSKAALQAAQLILRCLEIEPRKRPSMQEVVEELEKIAAIGKPKESKTEVMHSSSRLDNYRDTESEAVRGDTEDGRVSMDVGENVEELITSPYPPEEDSDAEIPQPYSSEDDCHEELEDELGDF